MGRDKGRGKGGGGGRGNGRRMFVENVEEMAIRDSQLEQDKKARALRREEEGDDEGEGAAEVGHGSGEEGEEVSSVFRVARKAPGPDAAGGGHEEEPVHFNPNRGKAAAAAAAPPTTAAEAGNRREREALEEQRRREEYMQRHLAGETEQARKDLERLAIVRKRREEAAAKRAAEGRAAGMSATGIESSDDDSSDDEEDGEGAAGKVKVAKAVSASPAPAPSAAQIRKKAAAAEVVEDATGAAAGPPKLKAMDIKKMNGDALKDALRERGLDVQGQKKDLTKRLLDFEAARA